VFESDLIDLAGIKTSNQMIKKIKDKIKKTRNEIDSKKNLLI
jgi:peptidoglycan hydrolase CwlO-like protein